MEFNIVSSTWSTMPFLWLLRSFYDNACEIHFQICNGVAVARLLNATLVLPTFLFNSVWRDSRCYFLTYIP